MSPSTLRLDGGADDDFTRRLKPVMSLIFAKLASDLTPGFLASGLGQSRADAIRSGADIVRV
jgi:hypothetical protein